MLIERIGVGPNQKMPSKFVNDKLSEAVGHTELSSLDGRCDHFHQMEDQTASIQYGRVWIGNVAEDANMMSNMQAMGNSTT